MSGVYNGRTTGAPLCIWISNRDVDSSAYLETPRLPRPGHADYTEALAARGFNDPRGGGHASGRLTVGLVAAGTIAGAMLEPAGIQAAAHLHQVGPTAGPAHAHSVAVMRARAGTSPVKTAHADLEATFASAVEAARKAGDSIGGVVEFTAEGIPPAWGDPFFDSVESTVSHILFAIPAVKGVDFGAGFAAATMRGSVHNDPWMVEGGKVRPAKNDAGGILGGRTTGAPLRGRVAVKPASSIRTRQQTVDLEAMSPAQIQVAGRHDACIAIRAVPVVQAALRIALVDLLLLARERGLAPA